jgi:hypothetical protein
MAYQNISYTLTPEVLQQVKGAIETVNASLPFLVTLTNDEKRSLVKLGPKSADFVNDASSAVVAFPNILPQSFNVAEYQRDTTLFAQLSEIKLIIDSLQEKVNNTYFAVGSEAMQASLEVYAYVQTAKERVPGIKSVAEKLKERFKSQGPKKKDAV